MTVRPCLPPQPDDFVCDGTIQNSKTHLSRNTNLKTMFLNFVTSQSVIRNIIVSEPIITEAVAQRILAETSSVSKHSAHLIRLELNGVTRVTRRAHYLLANIEKLDVVVINKSFPICFPWLNLGKLISIFIMSDTAVFPDHINATAVMWMLRSCVFMDVRLPLIDMRGIRVVEYFKWLHPFATVISRYDANYKAVLPPPCYDIPFRTLLSVSKFY